MSIRVTIRLIGIVGIAVGGLLPAHALNPECKGAGHWKQFDDILWPVTFAYPASWKFALDNGQLTLTCPDRDSMRYDSYGIAITQGKRGELANIGFFPLGTKWVYGAGCSKSTDAACKIAEMSVRNGMTILVADERELRLYKRNGGYVGEGEGHETLVHVTTIVVGHVIMQVTTLKPAPAYYGRNANVTVAFGNWKAYLIDLWPLSKGRIWPPPLPFTIGNGHHPLAVSLPGITQTFGDDYREGLPGALECSGLNLLGQSQAAASAILLRCLRAREIAKTQRPYPILNERSR